MLNINLETMPLGNGAGSIKFPDQVAKACKSPMTRITVGSITAKQRDGNIGDVYYFHPEERWSLNSLGLPNPGMAAYKKLLPEMAKMANGAGKELWASISPFSAKECGQMADECFAHGVDGVEVNGSCPNVWDGGKRKAIPALDPDTASEMFRMLGRYVGNMEEISFKLSPTDDKVLLGKLAEVLRKYRVEQLVCCNAKADQQGTRVDGKPALAFREADGAELKHVGGFAGSKLLPKNIAVARSMLEFMPEAKIFGLGGILTGVDAELYLLLGCVGIQSTTGYLEYGNQLFVDLLMYLADKVSA